MAVNDAPTGSLTNWAGNLAYRPARLHRPASVEELQEIVRGSRAVRLLGSRHSFNAIADTPGDLVAMGGLPRRFELDATAATVTVDGGVRYGDLCGRLEAAGFALHNLASLPHISVAGACATATHGSGNRNGNLATAVVAQEIVTADGELRTFSRDRDGPVADGTVVALGCLGAVTAITLRLERTFEVRQDLYEDLALATVADHFDEITAAADSVSLFTEWRGPRFEQVWLKRRVDPDDRYEPPATFFGARRATVPLHPIGGLPADACTAQLGVPGPWYERLPHFRLDHTPSAGEELQSEYLVDRRHAVDALVALDAVRDRFAGLLQVAEVRTIAADRLWLSTAQGRPSVALHFTWVLDWPAVREVLPAVEAALRPFDPRPHWGKLSLLDPEAVRATYPLLPGFVALVRRHDPEGTFRNAFVDHWLDGPWAA